jgi:hypothetical protein
MLTQTSAAAPPDTATVFNALRGAADALGQNFAYGLDGTFHFSLGDGWSISVCPESAGRLRLQACRWTSPVATLWTAAEDIARLKSLVVELEAEIERVRV